MLTYEDALFHKLLLESGETGELEPAIDRLLSEEEPLSEVVLQLAYAGGDPKKQLSALNGYLREAPEGSVDTDAVFHRLAEYLRRLYQADPSDLRRIGTLMYEFARNAGLGHDYPWYELEQLGDCSELIDEDLIEPAEYARSVENYLYKGELVYPRYRTDSRKKPGLIERIKKLLRSKRGSKSEEEEL